MSEIRIAWCTKEDGSYHTGSWHPISHYETLKSWITLENKEFPNLNHWLEEKKDNKITNYEDNDGFTMIMDLQ